MIISEIYFISAYFQFCLQHTTNRSRYQAALIVNRRHALFPYIYIYILIQCVVCRVCLCGSVHVCYIHSTFNVHVQFAIELVLHTLRGECNWQTRHRRDRNTTRWVSAYYEEKNYKWLAKCRWHFSTSKVYNLCCIVAVSPYRFATRVSTTNITTFNWFRLCISWSNFHDSIVLVKLCLWPHKFLSIQREYYVNQIDRIIHSLCVYVYYLEWLI